MTKVSNWSPCRIRSSTWPLRVDVLVEDFDADDVADDVGRAVVVAPDPDEAEVVAVGVAADHPQAGEVALVEPLEVEVVEDVAVDDQHARLGDGPLQEFLEQTGLADLAPQVQVADDQAVVGDLARRRFRGGRSVHRGRFHVRVRGRARRGESELKGHSTVTSPF